MIKTTANLWDQYTETEKKFLIALHRAQRISTHSISKLILENSEILEIAKNIYKNPNDSNLLKEFTNKLGDIDNYEIHLISLIIRIRPFYLAKDLSIYPNLFKLPHIALNDPKNFKDQRLRLNLLKEINTRKKEIQRLDFNDKKNYKIKEYIIEDAAHSKISGNENLLAFAWSIIVASKIEDLYRFILKEFMHFIHDPEEIIIPVFTGKPRNV